MATEIKKGHKVLVDLNREQVDFLDRISKDALFTTGSKLSRTKMISAIVDVIRRLGINGKGMKSKEELEARIIDAIRNNPLKETAERKELFEEAFKGTKEYSREKVEWLVVSGAVLVILVCVGIWGSYKLKREVRPPWQVSRVEEVIREEARREEVVKVKRIPEAIPEAIEILRVEEVDTDEDGIVDKWVHYRGEEIYLIERDTNSDGRLDLCEEFEEGKLFKRSLDKNFDGEWDLWEWFEDEEVVKREIDSDFDGIVETIEVV